MDTATPPPIVPPPPEQRARIGTIVRDVIIVWVLTALGGAVARLVGGPPRDAQQAMLAVAASNLILGTVAFTIVGCLAPSGRWRHLCFVALGAWSTSLINVVFFGVSILQWVGGAIFISIIMGIGGGISYVFKKNKKPLA